MCPSPNHFLPIGLIAIKGVSNLTFDGGTKLELRSPLAYDQLSARTAAILSVPGKVPYYGQKQRLVRQDPLDTVPHRAVQGRRRSPGTGSVTRTTGGEHRRSTNHAQEEIIHERHHGTRRRHRAGAPRRRQDERDERRWLRALGEALTRRGRTGTGADRSPWRRCAGFDRATMLGDATTPRPRSAAVARSAPPARLGQAGRRGLYGPRVHYRRALAHGL